MINLGLKSTQVMKYLIVLILLGSTSARRLETDPQLPRVKVCGSDLQRWGNSSRSPVEAHLTAAWISWPDFTETS